MEFISNEQLRFLIQLQEKDSLITEIVKKQKLLPDSIASLQQNLDRVHREHEDASRNYDNAAKEHRELEALLEDAEEKIKKLKGRIPEIKTNKEYQTLLKEIAISEEAKSDIEEKIIVLLEKMDNIKAVVIDNEQGVKEEERCFVKEKEKIEDDLILLSGRLKELELQKSLIVPSMDSKLLAEYNQLFSTRKSLAVVSVQDEHCRGCHMRIPPQIFSEIRKNNKIIHCSNCDRVLYWEPSKG